MGFFDFLNSSKPVTEHKSFEGFKTVNTEGMDLSQPFVDDYYNRGFKWVMFGENNLYPQVLNQLYISSPMHQACCNFKKYAITGKGYKWDGKLSVQDEIILKQFEMQSDFKQAFKKMTLDYIKHGRITLLIHYNGQRWDRFKHVDPQNIRNSPVNVFKTTPDFYYYSRDWTRSIAQHTFRPYDGKCKDEWTVLELRNDIGGFDSYGMPDWVSSANWSKVGADASLLHKSAIENGIQPSIIYKYPYLMSPDERTQWEDGMRKNAKGAKNFGRAMKVESNGKENTPDIEVVKTSDNHKLFEQTSREYKEEVAISHNINPALMGVRIAGALGQSEEIQFSAKQFKKVWLSENLNTIQDFINKLKGIFNVKPSFVINEVDIVDIIEASEENQDSKESQQFNDVKVNENLKGLTAKQNQDMMRIVRDYNKDRLSEPLARTRLEAYGISGDIINEILSK